MQIETDYGKASLLRQHTRKCTLSSTGHARDDNAATNQGRCVTLAHGTQDLHVKQPGDGSEIEKLGSDTITTQTIMSPY